PLQQPHPPVLLGTITSQGLDRVVRYCDGWIPIGIRLKDLPGGIRDLPARAERAGRKPSEIPVSIFASPTKEDTLRQYQELGIERVVSALPSDNSDKILPLLDKYAALITKFA